MYTAVNGIRRIVVTIIKRMKIILIGLLIYEIKDYDFHLTYISYGGATI